MKTAGSLLVLIAAAVIAYNVVFLKYYNDQMIEDHPVQSGLLGEGLERRYTFTAPYTEFEKGVLALGALGIVLVLVGASVDSVTTSRRRSDPGRDGCPDCQNHHHPA